MKMIIIIGGGASGTLLAINLIREARERAIDIVIIERRSRLGRGVAYGTTFDAHLLNVPAGRMGAFPDDLEHFHRWLNENGHEYQIADFVPRVLFGRYLSELLDATLGAAPSGVNVRFIDDDAVDLRESAAGIAVRIRSGETIDADDAVLAFGNFPPPHPNVPDLKFTDSKKYFQDPWGQRLYESVAADESLFIVGTGLSMADVALQMNRIGHSGKIYAISTRGLLPAVHELGHSYPSFYDEIKGMRRITDLLKAVRRHIAAAEAEGGNWRAVIDSLRHETPQIWMDLPVAEKRYFMQHLSRYWNVARHRMPSAAAAVLQNMIAGGKLEILRGRLKEIALASGGSFHVTFAEYGVLRTVSADVLVNCIGAQSNFAKVDSELVQNILAAGTVRTDELAMGLDATPDGRLIGNDGRIHQNIRTLGPALKGILWETTAIPEIRSQARTLALKLLSD